MLVKLLKKEWALCMHPAAWIMLGLAVLILIPNYPYAVSFFYMTLGIFFISMSVRENHDVTFTLTLPVEKRAIVTARICFAVELELISLLLASLMIPLHRALIQSAALFLLITADVVMSYALPFWRDVLDTPDPAHLGAKLIFLLSCVVFYLIATLLALRFSQRRFLKLDIR